MFDPLPELVLGLFTGAVFGLLLQKGQAAKYQVIMGQFLLKDWTVVKIVATAVVVGSIGVYVLVSLGMASLSIKPAASGGVILGGLLFGVGIAVFGLCPGTSVAACGEGHQDAIAGVVGMLVGAGVYVALFPMLKTARQGLGSWGEVTLADVTGTSPWMWITGLVIAGAVAALLLKATGHPPARDFSPTSSCGRVTRAGRR